jgi:hypothetical protein
VFRETERCIDCVLEYLGAQKELLIIEVDVGNSGDNWRTTSVSVCVVDHNDMYL